MKDEFDRKFYRSERHETAKQVPFKKISAILLVPRCQHRIKISVFSNIMEKLKINLMQSNELEDKKLKQSSR